MDNFREKLKEYDDSRDWDGLINIIGTHRNSGYGMWGYTKTEDGKAFELCISTGGWSENEKIVDMLTRTMFWVLYWQESRRGGYFRFGGVINHE